MATKKESWSQIASLESDLAWNANSLSAVQTVAGKFDIFDTEAREGVVDNRVRIDEISATIAGGVTFKGRTTTALVDGSETNPITIDGASYTAKVGDMVLHTNGDGKGDSEFIWNGTSWSELGSINVLNLGDLAFVNQTSASYTPAGSVAVSATADATAALTGSISMDDYTPEGTISCGDYTPTGSITLPDIEVASKDITVDEISAASFEQTDISVAAQFNGAPLTASVDVTPTTGTATFNGTLNQLPALTATGSVNTVTGVTESSAVAGTATVTDGVLSFTFVDALTSITTVSGDVDVTVSPSYQNTLTSVADISLSTSGTVLSAVAGEVTLTPEGTVTTTQFDVSGAVDLGHKTVTKTVAGETISQTGGSFTGDAASLAASFSGTAKKPTGDVSGNVTIPGHDHGAAFTGTQTTITGLPA